MATAVNYPIFVSRAIPPEGLAFLHAQPDVQLAANPLDESLPKAVLIDHLQPAEGLLCLLNDTIDAEVMAACSKLRVISNMAVGYNNIDVAEATRRHIVVTNTPGVLTEATADLTFALILAVARRLGEGERLVRSGQWGGWGPLQLLGGTVGGKTLGIIGMGRIGQAVARRARGFGMSVLYYNRMPLSSEAVLELDATYCELDDLIARSDFVSLHAPYSTQTHYLINARRLALMQPTAYLINTARGALVDEAELVAALRSGKIAGAGLDVYEHEPILAPGLTELDNVVLLPHLGSATHQTRGAMALLAAKNLMAALRGEKPPKFHAVNPEVFTG